MTASIRRRSGNEPLDRFCVLREHVREPDPVKVCGLQTILGYRPHHFAMGAYAGAVREVFSKTFAGIGIKPLSNYSVAFNPSKNFRNSSRSSVILHFGMDFKKELP